jgi:hypothetical protein
MRTTSEISDQVATIAARGRVCTSDVQSIFRELEDAGEASLEALRALLEQFSERFTPNARLTFDCLLAARRDAKTRTDGLQLLVGRSEGELPGFFLELRPDGSYVCPHQETGRWALHADAGVLTLSLFSERAHCFRVEPLGADRFALHPAVGPRAVYVRTFSRT